MRRRIASVSRSTATAALGSTTITTRSARPGSTTPNAATRPGRTPFTSSTAHQRRRRCVRTGVHIDGDAAFGKIAGRDPLDTRPTSARREGGREDVLGEAVARKEARIAESDGGELLRKRGERPRMDWLRAAPGDAPRGEIEAAQILDATDAQVVGKVRREADRAAVARERAQPLRGPLDEHVRRQQHAGP